MLCDILYKSPLISSSSDDIIIQRNISHASCEICEKAGWRHASENRRSRNQRAEREKNARQSLRTVWRFEVTEKEYREEIQNAVVEALASASWRRDVGLSDCTIGGGAGRRPWNFHVNKISGRESVRDAPRARESDAGHKKEKEKEEEGRWERRSETFVMRSRRLMPRRILDVEIHPTVTT